MEIPLIRNAIGLPSWWLVALACLGLTAIDLIGATTTPGYDFSRDTVSRLMRPDADYSNYLRGALITYGVLLIPFAIQITRRFRAAPPWRRLMVWGIWAHIVLMIAAALFQNDSMMLVFGIVTVNDLHDGGTVALFTAAMLTLIVAWLSAGHPRWALHTRHSRISLLVMLGMGALFLVSATTDLQGITERANTAAFMGWIAMTALSEGMWGGLDDFKQAVKLVKEQDQQGAAGYAEDPADSSGDSERLPRAGARSYPGADPD